MGNCFTVASFRRGIKLSDTTRKRHSTTSTVKSTTPTLPLSHKRDTYIVDYKPTSAQDSPLWNTIKNRKKRQLKSNHIKTTRYNVITFLPKNLYEQFHRVANIYFATLIGLNWVPVINAISKKIAFIPLAIVLTITAIKDLVEDIKRWRSDVKINEQSAQVYDKQTKTFIACKWEDLHVGNIVKVKADELVPADILLLSSSSSEGTCHLDTAAIDGETNLKQKSIPSCFLNGIRPEETTFELQCDQPNDDIYHFFGRILLLDEPHFHPCDNNNLLLRGCVLRITNYIHGLIVYAGNETKIIKSSRHTISKTALIERYINRDVLLSSIILVSLCLIGAGLSIRWGRSFGQHWIFVPFLLDNPFDNVVGQFFAAALRFLILYQVMVPIALYVSLDLVRVLQMYTIGRDKKLKYEHPISCRTFTINEDLGQIGYIFSDKTGTLTRNELVFKAMSIGSKQYSDRSQLPKENSELVRHYLTALATCNTSFIVHELSELKDRVDYQPKYEGDNADDLVLCQAASDFGVRMVSRSAKNITIRYIDFTNTNKVDQEYEILCLLPFDSSRKRMSIILRSNGEIFLYIKGADQSIWPLLSETNDKQIKDYIEQENFAFAEQGYRSLIVAYRLLTEAEYNDWFQRYELAANALEQRDDAISDMATEIERHLVLAGITAVEDKLQDGVPQTIATLRCAGIKIWLLTGDKQATALSTAQAASLINVPRSPSPLDNRASPRIALEMADWDFSESTRAQLNQHTHMVYYSSEKTEIKKRLSALGGEIADQELTDQTINRMGEVIAAQAIPVCLVVLGDDLTTILRHKPKEFFKAASTCQSVLFCRVSASQKRELVSIAKTVFDRRVLAIGDGANDVGMIRESHCGVAVYGREGSQAVAAGDFAVDRFECLRRLLLVHGAWCFTRMSELVLYTFMHNCAYVVIIFYHQFFNGYSGAASLHSFYILLYTSLFTVLPQCAAALFDQHVPADRALYEPRLYEYTLHARCYRMWSYWINILDGVWQSTAIFFIAYFVYINHAATDALYFGFSLTFSMTITSMIHVVLQTTHITVTLISSVLLSFFVFLSFTLIFDATCVDCLNGQSPYFVSFTAFRQPIFWLTNLLTIVVTLLPRVFVKYIYNETVNPLLSKEDRSEIYIPPTTQNTRL